MYNNILQLPLFQGLSKKEVTEIVEKVVLQFKSIPCSNIFAKQGDVCDKLIYILHGEVYKYTTSSEQNFTFEETIIGPVLIEPQSLFGINNVYQSTYEASSNIDIMVIDKKYVLSELMHYPIFELNYINILSSITQNQYKLIWEEKTENDLLSNFRRFVKSRIDKDTVSVILTIKMEDLAFQLNDTRLNVSKMLNDLKQRGKVTLSRKTIYIHDSEF